MDVLTEQRKLNATIYDIIKRLKFKNYKMNLFGTSSLQSQRFYSDYDFNTHISRTYRPIVLYNEFVQILSNQDMYFIELKIEYTNNTKRKIFDVTKLTKSMFKNIKFVKIDYVLWHDYHFKELSILYTFFTDTTRTIDDIKDDYVELIKDGNNYKALKRLFSMCKITKNKLLAVMLTRFFNSSYGELYI